MIPKTIFCDIDGTLLYHYGSLEQQLKNPPKLLPGVAEKLREWDQNGDCIILTTARRESCRKVTEKQLQSLGVFYDQLIMGITSGQRTIINDDNPKSPKTYTAHAIIVPRNVGLKSC